MSAKRRGFTLVEVLVGLTVAALTLTAGFAALAFVSDRAPAAELRTMEALVGASARELLVDWLRGARLQAPGGWGRTGMFQGTDAEDRGRANDEITFPTTARTPLSGRNTLIRLYIDHDDETPERGLVAELTRRVIDEPRRIELVPQADQLEIRYRPDIQEEDAEWMPDWAGQPRLPRAVEIVLLAAPGDSLPGLLRYPIRVSLLSRR